METNSGADTSGLYNLETATGEGGSSKESGESECDFDEKPSKSRDSKLGPKKKEKLEEGSSAGKSKKDKEKGYAALEGESEDSDMEVKSPFKGKKRSFKFSRKEKKSKDEDKAEKKKEKKSFKECDTSSVETKDDCTLASVAYRSNVVSVGQIEKASNSKLEKSDKKKEKKEKKEKEPKLKDSKGKEIKNKLKLNKDKKKIKSNSSLETDLPVFGASLEVAVQRSRCHDGVDLPVVVRSCIDYIQENGLQQEGIYRSSGLKTRVMELRRAYNNRENVVLNDIEPPIVASLLKQYLRELPENILTNELLPKFEDASSLKDPQNQEEIFLHLVQQLPPCNKLLLSWLMIHMAHVIEKERLNKMNVQNLSIVLCPTLNLTHRVMACLFAHTRSLFPDTQILKYIPPLSGFGVSLPVDSVSIAIELKKQESLLAQIHEEMSVGTVAKHREEQLWEAQRIVTQLKRQLRQTAPTTGPVSAVAESAVCEKVKPPPIQSKEFEIEKTDDELKLDLALPVDQPSPEIPQQLPHNKAEPVNDNARQESSVTCGVEEARQQESAPPLESKSNAKCETPVAATAATEICPKDNPEAQPNAGQTKVDLPPPNVIEQDLELALMIENLEREKLIEQIAQAIEKEQKSVERLQELLAEKSAWADSSDEEDESVEINEEEQEQLLAEILRENRELEEKNLMLQKQIEEAQEACLNYRVRLRIFEEKIKGSGTLCETIG